MDLPYLAEYAKSGRASCKGCKSTISKGELRLAVMVQSPFHDGKNPNWHHFDCFFNKQRPKTTDDIDHYESLRVEDQDRIKARVGIATVAIVPDKKGKKRAGGPDAQLKKEALKDFTIEYAKSGRALCRGCEQKILKDEVRISKKDFDTEVGRKYGGQDLWHHVTCFAQVRSDLGYFESGDKLPGFKSLKQEDQKNVKKQVVAIKQEDIPEEKKIKIEDPASDPIEKEYREQCKILFKHRDKLEKLDYKELGYLLEHNNQEIPSGKDVISGNISVPTTSGNRNTFLLSPAPVQETKNPQADNNISRNEDQLNIRDEFTIFGEFVGYQLRKLNNSQLQTIARYEINKILFHLEMQIHNGNSDIISEDLTRAEVNDTF